MILGVFMRILISGSSGLVGTALCQALKNKGHQVIRLVRDKSKVSDDAIFWDPENEGWDSSYSLPKFENMDAVVNLSGENIAGRWTDDKKNKIKSSRVKSTKTLSHILSSLKNPPEVLINGSAIGFYGDRGEELLTEESAPGDNFLSNVCQDWERAAVENLIKTKIRVVLLRTGMVLSTKGGGLATMLTPFKFGLGGVLGNGHQYMSFISLDDLVNIIIFLIENKQIIGPVNAVTPHPITNQEFTKTLGKVLHRPTILAVPKFLPSLIFGQMADDLLFASQKVYPKKLANAGYHFNYPTIESALKHELG